MTSGKPGAAPAEVAPGAVHIAGWLTLEQQRVLVNACREWAQAPVPIRHTRLPNGGTMSAQTVCVGWHWLPYRYSRTADDVNGAAVAVFPDWLRELGRRAVATAYCERDAQSYEPDVALINFYDTAAKLGMHQDKDERTDAPIVSLSIGDDCFFRFGNTENRGRPYTDLTLRSGDLFVFGGPSRLAYHGVRRVIPNTGPTDTGIRSGRLNLTLRATGLP